jgi:glucose/arabinose dehydrogenase
MFAHYGTRIIIWALKLVAAGLILYGVMTIFPGLGRYAASFLPVTAAASEPVGTRIRVTVADLPPPGATESAVNPPRVVTQPDGAALAVPDGFVVNVFAEGLIHPRNLYVLPNGDVLAVESSARRISILRDADGDGVAETKGVALDGLSLPFGVVWRDSWLYVAEVGQIRRFAFEVGNLVAGERSEEVTPEGSLGGRRGGHLTRNIVFSADGATIFAAIGSQSNVGEEPAPFASIQRFDASGTRQRTFAAGLRNPVGLALHPETGELWTVVNERDGLGDGLVPDYLAKVEEGAFFGWPYAYSGTLPDPNFGGRRPDQVAKSRVGDVLFRSHSAPLGLVFYDGASFPEEYRGDAFVAMHGSWNSAKPVGYTVVRVPFDEGKPRGDYEVFATGFRVGGPDTAVVWGRPAGVAVAKDGSLLIADDTSNKIFRVSYGR